LRPAREHTTNTGQTYMVTTSTWGRRALFRTEPWAKLLIDTLYHYRGSAYLLHEFVVMPDHLHVLFTPLTSLEKAVQFIKGGFPYRAKKELGSNMEVWQVGYSDHRIRDAEDYEKHETYVCENPVRCGLPQEYPYSSAHGCFELDLLPQGLKPLLTETRDGASKAAPFQSKHRLRLDSPPDSSPAGAPFQSNPEFSSGDREADRAIRGSQSLPSEKKTAASVNTLRKAAKVNQL